MGHRMGTILSRSLLAVFCWKGETPSDGLRAPGLARSGRRRGCRSDSETPGYTCLRPARSPLANTPGTGDKRDT